MTHAPGAAGRRRIVVAITGASDAAYGVISSGSYRTEGMVIIPCSIKTLSGVAYCHDDNLVVRAADASFLSPFGDG